jgi:2',3'-cyclic-nucleotide 2'-phosphodiesterase (5'-nucleotidase family)
MQKIAFCLLLVVSFSKVFASTSDTELSKQIQLVFAANMNDIASNTQGSYSRLYSLLEKTRKNPNTIFAFGGGSLGPSSMSMFDRGSHIIDILNSLEPDLMTVRKREFSYFEDELSLRSNEAAFPIIASNVVDPLTTGNIEGIYTRFIVERGDIKVGFMSVLEEEVVQEYLLNRVRVFESQTVIEGQAKKLRREGADIVIMMFAKKRLYYRDLLDSGTIDFAINSRADQDNTALSRLTHPNIFSLSQNNRALLLDIQLSDSQSTKPKASAREVLLTDYPENPKISMQINDYNHRLDRLLNQVVGHVDTPINTLRESVRSEENAFANFIADTLKDYKNADIGFINGGLIRGNKKYLQTTSLTRRDIASELPFRSRIIKVSASGEQIRQALEHGVSEIELLRGKFPHVSGLTYSFSTSKKPGKRVSNIKINGQDLDTSQLYSVATSDYIASGGDGFASFSHQTEIQSTDTSLPLISDIVILNIQNNGNIAPKLENRITRLDK